MKPGVKKGTSQTKEHIKKRMESKNGYRHSQKTRERMSRVKKGKKLTEEHKMKLREALEGVDRKNVSLETRKKLSQSKLGKKLTEEHKRRIGEAHKGNKCSEEIRVKLSKALKGKNGSNWQGGKTEESKIIRQSVEYRLWRESVFARDNWTCQKCGDNRGGNLNAHHIKNFAQFIELRTSIENGITLCEDCHIKFHKKYGHKNNTKEQLEKFLRIKLII